MDDGKRKGVRRKSWGEYSVAVRMAAQQFLLIERLESRLERERNRLTPLLTLVRKAELNDYVEATTARDG